MSWFLGVPFHDPWRSILRPVDKAEHVNLWYVQSKTTTFFDNTSKMKWNKNNYRRVQERDLKGWRYRHIDKIILSYLFTKKRNQFFITLMSVCWLIGRSVCHDLAYGAGSYTPLSPYQSTCHLVTSILNVYANIVKCGVATAFKPKTGNLYSIYNIYILYI